MLNCKEVKELISLYIDGGLDEKSCCEFEEHIDTCEECRLQLEEMTQLVFACRDLDEAELPEGFAEELHMKLAAVNQAERHKSGILNFPFNKIKVYSSVAAMFILVLTIAMLARGTILTPSKTGSPPEGMKFAAKKDASSAVPESANAKKAADNGKSYDIAGGNANDSVAMQAADSDGATGTKQADERAAETAQRSSTTLADSTAAQGANTLSAVTATAVPMKQTVKIQIYTSDVNTLAEELDKIAAANGGENNKSEAQFTGTAAITATITATTTATAKSDGLVVEYTIPNEKYNDFINSLTATYVDTGITTDKPVTQDLTAELDTLNKQAGQLDEKIKKAENNELTLTKDELLKLQEERKLLEQKISDLKAQTQYTYVTIELTKQ